MADVQPMAGPPAPAHLRLTRLVLTVQAVCMIIFLATLLPGYLDFLFRPLRCPADQWCLDFRGFTFGAYAVVILPLAALLAATAWLWRKRRAWPAIFPIGVDLFILLSALFPSDTPGPSPSVIGQALVLWIPAISSLMVVVAMLMRWFSAGRASRK